MRAFAMFVLLDLAQGKMAGKAEKALSAHARIGLEIEAAHGATIRARATHRKENYTAIGAGLLGDLNANGVNQYLIENEASIERVDLDTVRTDFLEIYYKPSYTLDEPKAKDAEWYDSAKELKGNINAIAKIRAKLAKLEKRLQKTTQEVISKTNLPRDDDKAMTKPPPATLLHVFTALEDAGTKFHEFVQGGFKIPRHDELDANAFSLLSTGDDPTPINDELDSLFSTSITLSNDAVNKILKEDAAAFASPGSLLSTSDDARPDVADELDMLFTTSMEGIKKVVSKALTENQEKEQMLDNIYEETQKYTCKELMPNNIMPNNISAHLNTLKATSYNVSTAREGVKKVIWEVARTMFSFLATVDEKNFNPILEAIASAQKTAEVSIANLETEKKTFAKCCHTEWVQICCSKNKRFEECGAEEVSGCPPRSEWKQTHGKTDKDTTDEINTCIGEPTASQAESPAAQAESPAEQSAQSAVTSQEGSAEESNPEEPVEPAPEKNEEDEFLMQTSSNEVGLKQTSSTLGCNTHAEKVTSLNAKKQKDEDTFTKMLGCGEPATNKLSGYIKHHLTKKKKALMTDNCGLQDQEYAQVVGNIIKYICLDPAENSKQLVASRSFLQTSSQETPRAKSFAQTRSQTTPRINPLTIMNRQGEAAKLLSVALRNSMPSRLVKKMTQAPDMTKGNGLTNSKLTAACCLKPKSGDFVYKNGVFLDGDQSFVYSNCPKIYWCYASALLNHVTAFIRLQNEVLNAQMESDSMRKIARDENTGGPFKAAYYNDVSKYTIEKIERAKDDDPSEGVMTAYMMRHEGKYCAYVLISHLRDDTMTKILAVLSDKKVPKADTVLILYALALELNAHPDDQLRKFSTDARFGGLVSYWRKFEFQPYTFIPDKDLTPEGNDWELWHKKVKMEAERAKVENIDAYKILNLNKAIGGTTENAPAEGE